MLCRVRTRNFKVFEDEVFDLQGHLVVVGPNNCGKTSLLQAIAAWSEIANHWFETNPDFVRLGDGTYPTAELNLLRFNAAPLPDFPHLWRNKAVGEPICIWLEEVAGWNVGFEIVWSGTQLAQVRPAKEVREEQLEAAREHLPTVVYVPPVSRLAVTEPPYTEDGVRARLQRGRTFEVLRNVLVSISRDSERWARLQEVVHEFFSYDLLPPSAGVDVIAHFRHRSDEESYDLGVAASGFLQVLASYAALLYEEASVILIDEPDAHLHLLLQEKIYRKLRGFAERTKSQLLVATHSDVIINEASLGDLRLVGCGLVTVGTSSIVKEVLRLENKVLILARTEPGILYLEGESDLYDLREWARVMGHRLLAFLDKPFWEPTAEGRGEDPAARHFGALRQMAPEVKGVELRDGDRKTPGKASDGLLRLKWKQMEIENYLLQQSALERFVKQEQGEDAAQRVRQYMERVLPAGLYEKPPFDAAVDVLASTKGSEVLSRILQEAGLQLTKTEYCRIAAQMRPEEIHPEVREKLDDMAAHLEIAVATN